MKTSINCSSCWDNEDLNQLFIMLRQWRPQSTVHHAETVKTSINCSSCWDNEDLNQLFIMLRQWRPQSTVPSCQDNEIINQLFIMSRQCKHQSTVHHVETMQTSINCSSCRDNENINKLFIMSRQWKHQSNVHHVNEDLNQLFIMSIKTSINCSSCWDDEDVEADSSVETAVDLPSNQTTREWINYTQQEREHGQPTSHSHRVRTLGPCYSLLNASTQNIILCKQAYCLRCLL